LEGKDNVFAGWRDSWQIKFLGHRIDKTLTMKDLFKGEGWDVEYLTHSLPNDIGECVRNLVPSDS